MTTNAQKILQGRGDPASDNLDAAFNLMLRITTYVLFIIIISLTQQ
jgi:hypothetical protein